MRIRPLLALGVVLAVLSLATTAGAVTQYVRIAGNDRVETAVVAANQLTPNAKVVYIATADNFPDALAASAAAALEAAPVLLVHAGSLPDLTRNEINALKPDKVVVVGGTAAISAQTRQDIAVAAKAANSNASVLGINGGGTRYDTAAAVSTYLRQQVLPSNQRVPVVYIASGESFPDALSGSAAAGAGGGPLLLVQPSGSESQSFVNELQALHPLRVVLLGGTGAVSQIQQAYIQQQAGAVNVERVQGSDRYQTSVAVATDAVSHGYFTSPAPFAFLATGENFPDGLAAGAIAGANKVPVLLTKKTCLPTEVSDEIDSLQPSQVYVMGGTGAVAWSLDAAPPAC